MIRAARDRLLGLLARRREVACPLCVGTDRADLRYDAAQLAEHALQAHDFEDVYDWTRAEWERGDDSGCMVGLLDASFDVVQTFTTYYTPRTDGWSWTCRRCGHRERGFSAAQVAALNRLTGHRCPL